MADTVRVTSCRVVDTPVTEIIIELGGRGASSDIQLRFDIGIRVKFSCITAAGVVGKSRAGDLVVVSRPQAVELVRLAGGLVAVAAIPHLGVVTGRDVRKEAEDVGIEDVLTAAGGDQG